MFAFQSNPSSCAPAGGASELPKPLANALLVGGVAAVAAEVIEVIDPPPPSSPKLISPLLTFDSELFGVEVVELPTEDNPSPFAMHAEEEEVRDGDVHVEADAEEEDMVTLP